MKVTGTDLRCMRLRSAKTTTEMASFAGVKTRKTYENWEKGKSTPDVNQFIAMAEASGFDAVQLLELFVLRATDETTVDVTKAFK